MKNPVGILIESIDTLNLQLNLGAVVSFLTMNFPIHEYPINLNLPSKCVSNT